MQSIQRSIMLLHPGDGPYINPKSRGTLKLQALPTGLAVLLTTTGLKPDDYALYLFLQDGAAIFAGDVTPAGLRRMLPGIRLNNVAGAAVIHSASLSFYLKSTNMDWTEAQPRFKILHSPRPAQPKQPIPEEKDPAAVSLDKPSHKPEDKAPAVVSPTEPSYEPEDEAPDAVLHTEPSHKPENEAPAAVSPTEPSYEPENETPDTVAHTEPSHKSEDEAPTAISSTEPQPDNTPGFVSEHEPHMPPRAENTDAYPPAASYSQESRVPEDNPTETAPCDNCPYAARQQHINPFPTVFPNSEWTKMSYPGPAGWWHYITGRIYTGSETVIKAVGVPGEYGMMPPVWLEGFGTYLRCNSPDAHGYWLMFQDAETGEILDMGLSPRDA